ncbi:DUF5714 domain-containing protein [Chloroflexota bacterium]
MPEEVTMQSMDNCGVCGQPLVYGTKEVSKTCNFCGKEFNALIYCPEGHYVCDECHRKEALDILREVLNSTTSTAPTDILEIVMAHHSVPMHGPEHHIMVPAIIITAVKNAGYPVPEEALEKAITRGSEVPGGWCGFHGACGAALGVGSAVSILTNATPLTGKTRALANEATAYALTALIDGGPRCCKRASRKALEAAIDFLHDRMDIVLDKGQEITCNYTDRNKECIFTECSYYEV